MSEGAVPILLVEDSPTTAILAEYWLRDGLPKSVDLHHADCLGAALEVMTHQTFQVVVLDLNLPDSQGIDTFRRLQAASPTTPVVILSGEANEEIAVEAVRLGAQDYVVKENGNRNVLARPVRYALERSRRQEVELSLQESNRQMFVARSIQQHLLAYAPPIIPGLEIAGHCEPADLVGGDFFDFVFTPDGSLAIEIGDVSGHGLPATLMMVESRAVLRALTRSFSDAATLLRHANEIISPDLNGGFVTMFLAVIDPVRMTMHHASAGHPCLLLKADGKTIVLPATTTPLGITLPVDDVDVSVEHTLGDGDILVLFTDGMTESFSPSRDMFGQARLVEVIRANRDQSSAELVGTVFEALHDYRGQVTPADDNTMVVIKISAKG